MKKLALILSSILLVVNIQNCDEAVSAPTEEEIADAVQLVDSANMLLFDALLNEGESDVMATVEGNYDQALALDPNNKGAHFGKAFMGIALISQDEDLPEAIDSWNDCSMFSDNPFTSEISNGMPRSIFNNGKKFIGVPQSIRESLSFDPLQFLHYLPIITSHEQILDRNFNSCPDISDIQDLLEDEYLSRISSAISHFETVLGTDFVFEITGEMMGDVNQQTSKIGDTEIYLMKAFMHQIRAMIYAIITYNVNIPYYSENPESDMIELLAQDSDFLTIRPGKENSWPNAHDDLNKVVDSIESALTFLQQNSSALSNEIEEDNISGITEAISQLRMLLNQDINQLCETEEPCAMTINISNYLNNPPQNMKNILPDYNLQIVWCDLDEGLETCLQLSWVATSCDSWKAGWDATIGGLLPNMTPEAILSVLSPVDCNHIVEFDYIVEFDF